MSKITIGVAAGRNYANYERWLKQSPDVEIVKLGYEENNLSSVSGCKGLLFTGGEDVHPKHYGRANYVDQFRLDDLDEKRDEFELKVLAVARKKRIPLLGICRGMQIANVFLGGTLIPDLQAFGRGEHKKQNDGVDRAHEIWLPEGTRLGQITGLSRGEVNSAHHQAVDLLGESLSMNCVSPDGVIEGAEVRDPEEHPFFMLVQWHPERMNDQGSAFSAKLRDSFVEAVRTSV
jgi:putative glutamine amidotransferase